jgi:hypothetical protein
VAVWGGTIDGPGPVVVKGMVSVHSGYLRFGGMPGNVLLGRARKLRIGTSKPTVLDALRMRLTRRRTPKQTCWRSQFYCRLALLDFQKTSNLKREAALLVPVEQLALARFVWK